MRTPLFASFGWLAASALLGCASSDADNVAPGVGGAGPVAHDASSPSADVVSSTGTGGSGGQSAGGAGSPMSNDAAAVDARAPSVDAGSAVTANSNASSDAHRILTYLTGLKGKAGKHVISGQNIGGDGVSQFAPNLAHYVDELHTQTGKWIALAGFGLGYPDLQSAADMQITRKYASDWWKTGGLVTMWASPGNPQTGSGNCQDTNFSGARDLITPGNPLNDKWKAILDRIATALAGLQDDGVVVLWRPLHEMNGNWFWWSMDNGANMSPADFLAIWKYEFDYFTNVKHLNNLLWVYSPNVAGGGMKAVDYYFPGSSVVDLGGEDFYNPDPPSLGATNYDKGRALTAPFGFCEFGPGQSMAGGADGNFDNKKLIDAINGQYRDISFFMYWSSWQGANVAIIDNKNATGLMNDPAIITRDDLAWK